MDLFQLVHEHVHRGEKNGLVCALLHPVETQDAIPEEKESGGENLEEEVEPVLQIQIIYCINNLQQMFTGSYLYLMKILFAVSFILMIQWGHIFTHAMAAVLPWHV